ncbi:MAG: hypothetical protein AAF722_02625 [Cyanobacteria bacterium P01_C01_bin.70]
MMRGLMQPNAAVIEGIVGWVGAIAPRIEGIKWEWERSRQGSQYSATADSAPEALSIALYFPKTVAN